MQRYMQMINQIDAEKVFEYIGAAIGLWLFFSQIVITPILKLWDYI